jgi:Saxitoxin biosynthesis operon protein SxtJ
MQWSDIVAAPKPRVLRQFAGLCLAFFGGLAVWRAWHGDLGPRTEVTALVGLVLGGMGLVRPPSVRWVYTAAMVAAFPIGWAVSQVMLAGIFYLIFTPVAIVFALVGRDVLRLKRPSAPSLWTPKEHASGARGYLRQS